MTLCLASMTANESSAAPVSNPKGCLRHWRFCLVLTILLSGLPLLFLSYLLSNEQFNFFGTGPSSLVEKPIPRFHHIELDDDDEQLMPTMLGPVASNVSNYIHELHKEVSRHKSKVALCVTGQAREYHLTGYSQRKHLLSGWENVDLFLNLVFDENAYKVAMLAGVPNVAAVRVAPHVTIDENLYPTDVINGKWSGGTQGIFEQLSVVQECKRLVKQHEEKTGLLYRWIVRMRADAFWYGHPPPIESFDWSKYSIPYGNNWHGYNDRMGVGNRKNSFRAFNRLRKLHKLREKGHRWKNAESSFKLHLEEMNVPVGFVNLPYCTMSHRTYDRWSTPVFSLTSKGPLNGAYCRPCYPWAKEKEAMQIVKKWKSWEGRWIGPNPWGAELCDAKYDWTKDWEKIYDSQTPREYGEMRKNLAGGNFFQCLKDLTEIRAAAEAWEAPEPESMCEIRYMGNSNRLGGGGCIYPTLLWKVKPTSIVYSFGIGQETSWEKALMQHKKGLKIFSFDGTPRAAIWEEVPGSNLSQPEMGKGQEQSNQQWKLPWGMERRPWILATKTGLVTIRSIKKDSFITYTASQVPPSGFQFAWGEEEYQGMTLANVMAKLGHTKLDILKISLDGYEIDIIRQWAKERATLPVCQLLVNFADMETSTIEYSWQEGTRLLKMLGFDLFRCDREKGDWSFKCGYISKSLCPRSWFKD